MSPDRPRLFPRRLPAPRAAPARRSVRRREGRFRRRQLLQGRFFGRARAIEIRLGIAHFLLQRFQLGATLQRPGSRRAAVEEDGAVGAAQRAAADHLVAGEQGADPRRRGPVHAQLVLERVAVGAEPRSRDTGQQQKRARLCFPVPRADGVDGGRIADQHRVQPFAQQPLRQLGIAPARPHKIDSGPMTPGSRALSSAAAAGASPHARDPAR